MHLIALHPKLVDLRAEGSVEMALDQSIGDLFICQFVCFDHGPATAGGLGAMVIIGCDGIDPLTLAQELVIYMGDIILISADPAAVVEYLHGIHTGVVYVVLVMLRRPGRMIVGNKEALLPCQRNIAVCILSTVAPGFQRMIIVKADLILQQLALSPNRLWQIVGHYGYHPLRSNSLQEQ